MEKGRRERSGRKSSAEDVKRLKVELAANRTCESEHACAKQHQRAYFRGSHQIEAGEIEGLSHA